MRDKVDKGLKFVEVMGGEAARTGRRIGKNVIDGTEDVDDLSEERCEGGHVDLASLVCGRVG